VAWQAVGSTRAGTYGPEGMAAGYSAARALARIATDPKQADVARLLKSENVWLRAGALRGLSEARAPGVEGLLRAALDPENPALVRQEARGQLAPRGGRGGGRGGRKTGREPNRHRPGAAAGRALSPRFKRPGGCLASDHAAPESVPRYAPGAAPVRPSAGSPVQGGLQCVGQRPHLRLTQDADMVAGDDVSGHPAGGQPSPPQIRLVP